MARASKTGGKTSKAKARNAGPAKGRKPAKPVRGSALKRRKGLSVEARLKLKAIELHEALAQQAATAEVLQVIGSSSGDLAMVFDTMLEKAMHLCGAQFGVLATYDGKTFRTAATRGLPDKYAAHRARSTGDYGPGTAPFRHLQGEPIVHIIDLMDSDAYRAGEPNRRALVELGGARCLLCVPLLSDQQVIGCVMIFRKNAHPFSDQQIALLKHFAAQAVIAIENARLFNETKEALERQTATSEVLKVISDSPGELNPVFNAMLENAVRICEAKFGNLFLVDGDSCCWTAGVNTPEKLAQYFTQSTSFRPTLGSHLDRVMRTREVSHTADDTAEAVVGAAARFGGARSTVCVPMVKDDTLVGAIFIYRTEVRPFTDKQIDLVKSFAAQAVIAIENARLFEQVQARTEDLRESLTYQTAISDVLNVISRSPSDIQPVLDTIAETAQHLCQSEHAYIFRLEDDKYHLLAARDVRPERTKFLMDNPIIPNRGSTVGRVAAERRPIHIMDALADNEYKLSMVGHGGRTILGVPLLRDGIVIGVIVLTRGVVHPFSERQIELVSTFADQALIAIENVRLFDEVQARTHDLTEALTYQTGSSNILRVIASSPTDVGPVLNAIVESACELCDAVDALVLLKDGDDLHYGAHCGPIPYVLEKSTINRNWVTGRSVIDKVPIHVLDMLSAEGDEFPDTRERARRTGTHTYLCVPLLRERKSIGAILLRRTEVHPFSEKQIALLQTFAHQAVIAIGNVRLFEQVQERTRELSQSLDDLRTAQDRLVQTEKLASLGQLTAGIAHEIKNPLNFVNNFSALSAELIEEMRDMLSDVSLDKNKRKDLDEITQMLKSNLDKVVQHGKRADSIVKNMLLHSRQGSGEHRPVDINAIVDESLNLAYHGARAENTGFNITMHRRFDPAVGMANGYPQEITRALLNLISNGFYAATKRKSDADDGFEPTLTATTKNLGDKVEIRIRDNGTGIPTEVKEKIFNPFFTTKPAGEGTGLGLSMSHDIIVKQHGGTIDVDSAPGVFTEFKIVLPRAEASLIKPGEHP